MKTMLSFAAFLLGIVLLFLLVICAALPDYTDMYWVKGRVVEVKPVITDNGILSSTCKTPVKVLLENGYIIYDTIWYDTSVFVGVVAYQQYYTSGEDSLPHLGNLQLHTGLSLANQFSLKNLGKPVSLLANLK